MDAFLILFILYVTALLVLSWYVGRNETEEEFLIAGRSRSWFQVGMSKYAASIGAGWFIAYSGFAYEYGLPVFLIFGGAAIGVLVYAFWAVPKIRQVTNRGAYTLGDYIHIKTKSDTARNFLNITAVAMLVLNLLIAVVGGASLLEVFGLFSYEVAVLVMVATVVSYILLSGFQAVMVTDVLQGGLLLLLLPLIVFGIWHGQSIDTALLYEVRNISILGMTMLTVFGVVSVFADPTRFQLTFAGKGTQEVARGMVFSIAPILFTGVVIYLLSNAVYHFNAGLESAAVFPTALQEYLPLALLPLGFLAFFVAVMSTTDSNLYALAAHTSNFVFGNGLRPTNMRWLVLGYGIVLTGCALIFRDVIDLAVLTGALLIVVAIPVIYLIAGGGNGLRFVALLGAGWSGGFLGVVVIGLKPDAAILVLVGFIIAGLAPTRLLQRLA